MNSKVQHENTKVSKVQHQNTKVKFLLFLLCGRMNPNLMNVFNRLNTLQTVLKHDKYTEIINNNLQYICHNNNNMTNKQLLEYQRYTLNNMNNSGLNMLHNGLNMNNNNNMQQQQQQEQQQQPPKQQDDLYRKLQNQIDEIRSNMNNNTNNNNQQQSTQTDSISSPINPEFYNDSIPSIFKLSKLSTKQSYVNYLYYSKHIYLYIFIKYL